MDLLHGEEANNQQHFHAAHPLNNLFLQKLQVVLQLTSGTRQIFSDYEDAFSYPSGYFRDTTLSAEQTSKSLNTTHFSLDSVNYHLGGGGLAKLPQGTGFTQMSVVFFQ